MADGSRTYHHLVVLSPEARKDLFQIYDETVDLWGTDQADIYAGFLLDIAQMLADTPKPVPLIPNFPNVRSYFARWKNARQGHRIFFEETEAGINIIRILHSRMNWPEHLRLDD